MTESGAISGAGRVSHPAGACSTFRKRGFTLVELLVVISIVGVVTGMVLTHQSTTTTHGSGVVVTSEIDSIRRAYGRFTMDCLPDDTRLEELRRFGFWPLMTRSHPGSGADYAEYDAAQGAGWAGPYLQPEGERVVHDDPDTGSGRQTFGQETETTGIRVPVLVTPWGDHYRLLAPRTAPATYVLDRLLVVALESRGSATWNGTTQRWEEPDAAAAEQTALSDFQDRLDYWLSDPSALATPLSPDEALEELRAEFPGHVIAWLDPAAAREAP